MMSRFSSNSTATTTSALAPSQSLASPRPTITGMPTPTLARRRASLRGSLGECRKLELAPVHAGCHAGDPLEQTAEGRGVLVPDGVADRVDGFRCPLEPALGLLDAD